MENNVEQLDYKEMKSIVYRSEPFLKVYTSKN